MHVTAFVLDPQTNPSTLALSRSVLGMGRNVGVGLETRMATSGNQEFGGGIFMATNVKSFVLFSFSVTFHLSASTQVFRKTFITSSLET